MYKYKFIFNIIILFLLFSCESCKNIHLKNSTSVDIKNYTGNAFVFFSDDAGLGNLVFIFPVPSDSISFLKLDFDPVVENTCIQIRMPHNFLIKLFGDKNKRKFMQRECGLPFIKNLYYSKVFISYRNFSEIKTTTNYKTSCDIHLIDNNDSSSFFIFNIYK